MNEQLLHYIWKTQSFISVNLTTTDGLPLKIYYPGSHNHDSGPDFSGARLKIDQFEWSGHVEIHKFSSDWYQHSHDGDPAYSNVVLHVVWEHDREVLISESEKLPVLEMKKFVDMEMIHNYERISKSNESKIPCQELINDRIGFAKLQMIDKTAVERIQEKAEETLVTFRQSNQDWEETVYQLLGRSFGLKINKEPFKRLTEILPLKLIRSHRNHPNQVMALLFGQAGFLREERDEYQQKLKREYEFLKKKYQLQAISRHHWKFSKLRPYSFPTIRIALFAGVLMNTSSLYSFVQEINTLKELKEFLNKSNLVYWKNHTDFGRESSKTFCVAGDGFANTIILNTLVPILAAGSKHFDDFSLMDKAIYWLESLPFELNSITKKYKSLNFKAASALDSQGQIHLYKEYCLKKRCLSCNIGVELMK